jgi:hypothetical protein
MQRKTLLLAAGAFLLGLTLTRPWQARADGGVGCYSPTPEWFFLDVADVQIDGRAGTFTEVGDPRTASGPTP